MSIDSTSENLLALESAGGKHSIRYKALKKQRVTVNTVTIRTLAPA